MNIIKELASLAEKLDKNNLIKEADIIDNLILKISKNKVDLDKDDDGDNDFRDIMISRMIASGLSKEEAIKLSKKYNKKPKKS